MSSINFAISQAVHYLTRPLALSYPEATVARLQRSLSANFPQLFTSRSAGHRCLTLSPSCIPPRVIYDACLASDVQWFDWITLLGNREFDLIIEPGCVFTRTISKSAGEKIQVVWSDGTAPSHVKPRRDEASIQAQLKAQVHARAKSQSMTLAQQLLEDDQQEDERLFAMIAHEVNEPFWTPTLDQFPKVPRSTSPLSIASNHSRSSSCSTSSKSSSGVSFSSVDSVDSYSAYSSKSSSPSRRGDIDLPKQSRRERARQSRVYIDTTKVDVTPYDGGKTTVLTGGVMLGAKAPTAHRKSKSMSGNPANWRRA